MNKYIKKIKINTVEDFLGKSLKFNKIVIGFDVAQHITGIAIIRTTNNYFILEKINKIETPKLPKKATSRQVLDNIDLFISQLDEFKNEISKNYKLDINRIEDCFFGKNVRTLKSLARASVLVYDRFRNISTDIDFILPNSARSKINYKKSKKKLSGIYLKKDILNYINTALDTKLKDYDIADGIVLALSGLVEE